MTDATPGLESATASRASSPRVATLKISTDASLRTLHQLQHDRDKPRESIESGAFSPIEKKSFDLADPGLFLFPGIPRGKLCSYPWFRREPASTSLQRSEKPPAADRKSETPTSILISCSECGKTCRDAKALSQHKRCHLKQHRCAEPGCDLGFSTRRDLERHRASVHENTSTACPYCLKSFGRRADNLKRHIADFCHGRRRSERRQRASADPASEPAPSN